MHKKSTHCKFKMENNVTWTFSWVGRTW